MAETDTTESMEGKIDKIEITGEADRIKRIEKKIIGEAEEKARSIVKEAEKTKKETIEQSIKEAQSEAEKTSRSEMEEADSLKRQKVAEARLKAKQMVILSREDLINEAMHKARDRLLELAESKEHSEVLQRLIKEGATGLGGGELEIVLAGKALKANLDLDEIARNVEEKTGNKTTISISKEKSKSIGGVVVRRADGSIMIDNTFDARIERAIRDIRTRVAKILFE